MLDKKFCGLKPVIFIVLSLVIFVFPYFLSAQTPPDKFLGFRVGEDRKLADYNQIKAYFELLDKESSQFTVLNIGQTTLGKDMIMAVDEVSKPYQHNGPAYNESGNPEFHEIESRVSQERESENPVHFQSFYQHLQNQSAHDEGAKQRATDTDR